MSEKSAEPLTAEEEALFRAEYRSGAIIHYQLLDRLFATLDAERAAHKATEGHAQILLRDIDTLAARVQRLEEAIQTALRCIEETGLIKSACDGLRAALAADQKKES